MLQWLCAECNAVYTARVDNNCVSTGQCQKHVTITHNKVRKKYTGVVPANLLRPIRAALLQGIKAEHIVPVIVELLKNSETCAIDDPKSLALAYVQEIYNGGYTRIQLLDSTFWRDGLHQNRDRCGQRRASAKANIQLHSVSKRQRLSPPLQIPTNPASEPLPLIPFDFRSPPWGPVWPAPDATYARVHIAPVLNGEYPCAGRTLRCVPLSALVRGEVVAVWPAVARWILGLPHPLRPWRLDPARRCWYADTLAAFLTQTAAYAVPGDAAVFLAGLAHQLRSADAVESVVADLEAAHAAQMPSAGPPPPRWPRDRLLAAQRRAAVALNADTVHTIARCVRDELTTSMWPAFAAFALGVPYPLGAWRLSPGHLCHCHGALLALASVTRMTIFACAWPRLTALRERLEATAPASSAVLDLLCELEAAYTLGS